MAQVVNNDETKIKTLANCSTIDFLKQANKIRKAVGQFYDECNFGQIMRGQPEFPMNATETQREDIARNFRKNQLNEILDICLETNVEKTVEIIGLMCFMEKKEAENTPANILLGLALDLISNQAVIDFFSKMAKSGMIDMGNT